MGPSAFSGPACGQNGYIARAVLGVPNSKRGNKIRSDYLITTIAYHAPCATPAPPAPPATPHPPCLRPPNGDL